MWAGSVLIGLAARIVLFAVLATAFWAILTRFNVATDLGVFLPATTSSAEKILIKQLGKGATSKLLFVALSGAGELELREKNKLLAAKLKG